MKFWKRFTDSREFYKEKIDENKKAAELFYKNKYEIQLQTEKDRFETDLKNASFRHDAQLAKTHSRTKDYVGTVRELQKSEDQIIIDELKTENASLKAKIEIKRKSWKELKEREDMFFDIVEELTGTSERSTNKFNEGTQILLGFESKANAYRRRMIKFDSEKEITE